MSFLSRFVGNSPPKLKDGEVVRLESIPTPGVFKAVLEQRPYAVMLDSDHQEIDGTKRYLRRQAFTDDTYAGEWCTWVEGRGSLPPPPEPVGAE